MKQVTKLTEQDKISVCDVMKSKTSSLIRKMESQIPSYVQEYADLYAEYLHTIDDLFGTCYLSEKEFFDKLNIDQRTLKAFDNLSGFWEKTVTSQIELSTNFMRTYVQMRISAIKSYDKYVHIMMDSYAKMLSQYGATYFPSILFEDGEAVFDEIVTKLNKVSELNESN